MTRVMARRQGPGHVCLLSNCYSKHRDEFSQGIENHLDFVIINEHWTKLHWRYSQVLFSELIGNFMSMCIQIQKDYTIVFVDTISNVNIWPEDLETWSAISLMMSSLTLSSTCCFTLGYLAYIFPPVACAIIPVDVTWSSSWHVLTAHLPQGCVLTEIWAVHPV